MRKTMNNNPVFNTLRNAGVPVTREQVEAYTQYKFMREQYYRTIAQVAQQIWKERYQHSVYFQVPISYVA